MLLRTTRRALLAVLLLVATTVYAQDTPVAKTMAGIVDRLCATLSEDQLLNFTLEDAQKAVTPEEREVLATQYWSFDVNVPVVVSIMRHVDQQVVPFWLTERGFTKTDMLVKNEEYTYEVWQKSFGAGRVGLGINGFDKHRPHYFVCVGPQDPAATLELANFIPENQQVLEMREGSTIYHDWTELVITELPDALRGQFLLPTIRGRAREAQLVGAFRKTPFPSSEAPDQVLLTWSADPRSTQTVQWRSATSVPEGLLQYREKGASDWNDVEAERSVIEDGFLINDRRIHWFTATATDLEPATTYEYTVGAPDGPRSEPATFTTAPDGDAPFTFVVLSDTHNRPESGQLLADAEQRYPDAAFATISGDLVGTGQYRDDWDKLFDITGGFFNDHALVPALGNHDSIDGLGADLYRAFFALPTNGHASVPPEESYSLEYGNALFLILDTDATVEQAPWIEERLKNSDAKWKFAVFHFPPYAPDEDYPVIRREWCSLFDKYGVDFVLSGHVHYYMRSKPLRGGQPTGPQNGVVYVVTVAVPNKERDLPTPEYAEVFHDPSPAVYAAFTVDGNRATLRTHDATGQVLDEYTKEKPAASSQRDAERPIQVVRVR